MGYHFWLTTAQTVVFLSITAWGFWVTHSFLELIDLATDTNELQLQFMRDQLAATPQPAPAPAPVTTELPVTIPVPATRTDTAEADAIITPTAVTAAPTIEEWARAEVAAMFARHTTKP